MITKPVKTQEMGKRKQTDAALLLLFTALLLIQLLKEAVLAFHFLAEKWLRC